MSCSSPSPQGIGKVECGEEGGRVISKAHSGAIEPGSTHFPCSFLRVGRPLLRSVTLRHWAVALGLGRKCMQEVHAGSACTPSLLASGCGEGYLRTLVTTPLWQLSLQIGRTSRGQGTSSCLLSLASLRFPEQPWSPFLGSKPNNDRRRNSSVPCSLRGSAMCLCTMSTLQYLLTAVFSSLFPVLHF